MKDKTFEEIKEINENLIDLAYKIEDILADNLIYKKDDAIIDIIKEVNDMFDLV